MTPPYSPPPPSSSPPHPTPSSQLIGLPLFAMPALLQPRCCWAQGVILTSDPRNQLAGGPWPRAKLHVAIRFMSQARKVKPPGKAHWILNFMALNLSTVENFVSFLPGQADPKQQWWVGGSRILCLVQCGWRWGADRENHNFISSLAFVVIVVHLCMQRARGPSARAREQSCHHHCSSLPSRCHRHPRGTTTTVGYFVFLWAGLARRTRAGIFLKVRFIEKRCYLIFGDKKFHWGSAPKSGVDPSERRRENPTPCKVCWCLYKNICLLAQHQKPSPPSQPWVFSESGDTSGTLVFLFKS